MPASVKRDQRRRQTPSSQMRPALMTPDDRRAAGRRLRDKVSRDAHSIWRVQAGRADPIDILRRADATRQPDLVPLRYGRMLQTPFTFYRGAPDGTRGGLGDGRSVDRPAALCAGSSDACRAAHHMISDHAAPGSAAADSQSCPTPPAPLTSVKSPRRWRETPKITTLAQ